ncbi:DELLA protein RGL1 [Amborella trichopoda]|uniref:Uncharacterized protein n=1 Tax=Amborella trichopoda TaxID=13333 RepID=W1PZ11_AMBTC|nr:DELLA protein RGL1 [Amborella trichopoda]ERN13603.1 hypothetical protein AMTR_s00049p00058940 [Amborella trichopoda]|eukprot:XP_006852136.1 DELLA protein RGL1 [Amborella trichopoda]
MAPSLCFQPCDRVEHLSVPNLILLGLTWPFHPFPHTPLSGHEDKQGPLSGLEFQFSGKKEDPFSGLENPFALGKESLVPGNKENQFAGDESKLSITFPGDESPFTSKGGQFFGDESQENRLNKRLFSDAESPFSGKGNWFSGRKRPRADQLGFRDHVLTYKEQFAEAESLLIQDSSGGAPEAEDTGGGGVRLVQLLMACAEAVACRDQKQARTLLFELHAEASPFGAPFQRVAACFAAGLSARLATLASAPGPLMLGQPSMEERSEALRLAYEACPFIKFGHFVANAAVLEAFEGENSVHVVDLGMTACLPHAPQWRSLLRALAARPGGLPRCMRLTAVGPRAAPLNAIGAELCAFAQSLGIDLQFAAVETTLESLKPEDLAPEPGEALAVCCVLELHRAVKESRGALHSALRGVHRLAPRVLTVVEQDSGHNGPFFLGRFTEALHYYSSIFDALDASLPRGDTGRMRVEQHHFGEEIKNIVACEGADRVERHERADQWRRRMSRAGFQSAPIRLVGQARRWLADTWTGEGYTVVDEKGCLVLGWKSRPIVVASCWKCAQ